MCCIVAALFALGPRAAILIWWLIEPVRWSATFDTFVWPFLGFLILPWTTLMYVVVFPGGIEGFDFVWLLIAISFDVFTWFGGGYTNLEAKEVSYLAPLAAGLIGKKTGDVVKIQVPEGTRNVEVVSIRPYD